MHENGRMLDKIYFNRILGQNSEEYLYPCLKQQTQLQVLNFNGVVLNDNDAKAIGKVLTDFKQIRELNLTDSGLVLSTVKEIADGLMRAKQLEVLKVGSNTQMGRGVNTLIYNLAFSPKIRYIDLSNISGTDAETAEAIYKLIKISGAVQTLILQNSSVVPQLTEDFYKALGENKTLEYINLDTIISPVISDNNVKLLGKAIGMNARKNGSLRAVSIRDWFLNYAQFDQFLSNMNISDQDHEIWYGDKKEANSMEKDQLVKKFYFALEYLGLEGKNQPLKLNHTFKPKEIRKQNRQVWPTFLHLSKHTEIELKMRKCFSSPKDMELVAYAIGLNPLSESKIRSIDLSKNTITKEGAKLLAPSLENNKFLITLDLSHTKIGVSGMMHLAESLLKNNTLKHLNLYRNIIDVDGARSLGSLLKVNTSLEFIDVGHNRIRKTGLTAICDGILANPDSKLTQLGIRSNFINDDGFTYLFDKLVSGNKKQLSQLFIK